MPYTKTVSKRHFKDIDKTSSNLATCPEAVPQGDFPMLPSEINGILP